MEAHVLEHNQLDSTRKWEKNDTCAFNLFKFAKNTQTYTKLWISIGSFVSSIEHKWTYIVL